MSEKSRELVRFETDKGQVALSLEMVRDVFAPPDSGVTPAECQLFIELCRFQRLNPFLREAYIVKYSKKRAASLVVGKEAFTKRAEKHEAYQGCKAGIWVIGAKLEQRTGSFYLPDEKVVGGWAEVWRSDQEQSIEASVAFREYVALDGSGQPMNLWKTKPATMIRKVALVQALREAFPDIFGGMYTEEEMQGSEQIAEEIRMPGEKKEAELPKTANLGSGGLTITPAEKSEAEFVDDDPVVDKDLEAAADAGFKAQEIKPEQVEGKGYFEQIVAIINGWKEASKILPYMKKANAAKGNEKELEAIYNEIREK